MDTVRKMLSTIPTLGLVPIVIVTICLSFIVTFYLYTKIRPKFPVKVNCWFCNKSTDVPYGNRNCWDCPHCDQYNGFSLDGGYNKVIPAQHDELLNHPVAGGSSFTKKTSPHFNKSPLCRKCNINQELKVQQLASFTPREPACFDEEVEEYRQHLERAYQLCESCELAVQQTLYRQQSWLLDEHRKRVLSNSPKASSPLKVWWESGLPEGWLQRCHFLCMTEAFTLFVAYHHQSSSHFSQFLSPDIAYFLKVMPKYESHVTCLTACVMAIVATCSCYRARIDVFSAALWGVLFGHSWLLSWPKFKETISEDDLRMGHTIVLLLAFIVNSLAALVPRQQYIARRINERKRENARKTNICNISSNFESSEASSADEHSCMEKTPSTSPIVKNSLETPAVIPTRKSTPDIPSRSPISKQFQESPNRSPANENLEMQCVKSPDLCTTPQSRNSSIPGEIEWGLGKLSLGPSYVRGKNNPTFGTKLYGSQDSLNVFHTEKRNNLPQQRSTVLRPPKLNMRRNVTQSSWVAGGYWQDLGGSVTKATPSGQVVFESTLPSFTPLSRSSSQSSGFHSQSSQSPASVPNSCNGSVCGGELDHASVLSEPAFPTQTNYPMFRPHYVGIPYYGYPMYMCPVGLSPASGMMTPRNPSFFVNPCFVSAKQYLHGAMFGSPFSPTPTKEIPPYSPVASDALSHVDSSRNSSAKASAKGPMKKKVDTGWLIMKQNIFLSVLFVGSMIFNVVGVSVLVYRNLDVMT